MQVRATVPVNAVAGVILTVAVAFAPGEAIVSEVGVEDTAKGATMEKAHSV